MSYFDDEGYLFDHEAVSEVAVIGLPDEYGSKP